MSNYIQQTNYQQQISNGYKLLLKLTLGLSVVTIVTILQDLIHSRLNNYHFYFSESLLFKTFWFLFFPLLFFQLKWLRNTDTKIIHRTVLAVVVPILVHLLLTPLIIFAVSAFFYDHTYSYYQTLTYIISEDVYKLLLIYGASFFLSKYIFAKANQRTVETFDNGNITDNLKTPTKALQKIVVSSGRKYVPISVSDILYIKAATPYIAIQLDDKRFLHSESLKSINEKLDQTQFIRVHKSTIVNLDKVVSYKSRLNGDYDLRLENGEEIRLSRNYSTEFKHRFNIPSAG